MKIRDVTNSMGARVIQTPLRYVQGPGILNQLGKEAVLYADQYMILAEDLIFKLTGKVIAKSLEDAGINYTMFSFGGECCRSEVQRILEVIEKKKIKGLIGLGGGKVLDTGKYAAAQCNIPYVAVPSTASTDAPCTSVVVLYTETGQVEISINVMQNPQVVFVDSQLIAEAPLRLFVSGMGDALATYFEACVAEKQKCNNILGGQITVSAMVMARACYDILMTDGHQAVEDLKKQKVTLPVERVIEANILLSGIGFESGGLSLAHGIHNALKGFPETHVVYHGELVAFGTLCLLDVTEQGKEFADVMKFCVELGLPVTLQQLGIEKNIEEKMRQAAKDTITQPPKYHIPQGVSEEEIYNAFLRVDSLGKEALGAKGVDK